MRKIVDKKISKNTEISINILYDDNENIATSFNEGDIIYVEYIQNGIFSAAKGKVIYITKKDYEDYSPNDIIKIDCSEQFDKDIKVIFIKNIVNVIAEKDLIETVTQIDTDFAYKSDFLYKSRWVKSMTLEGDYIYTYEYNIPLNYAGIIQKLKVVGNYELIENMPYNLSMTFEVLSPTKLLFKTIKKPKEDIYIVYSAMKKDRLDNFFTAVPDTIIQKMNITLQKDLWFKDDTGLNLYSFVFPVDFNDIIITKCKVLDDKNHVKIESINTEKGIIIFSTLTTCIPDIDISIAYISDSYYGEGCFYNEDGKIIFFDNITSAIDDALNKGKDNLELTLASNIKDNITVPSGVHLTVNLNGCIITNTDTHTFYVNPDAFLTIKDNELNEGVIDSIIHKSAAIYNKGYVNITGGTITRSVDTGTSVSEGGTNTYYTILNHGQMVINDPAIVSVNTEIGGKYSSLIENGYSKPKDNKYRLYSILLINGGSFSGGLNNIKNDDYGILSVKDGTFMNVPQHCIMNWNQCTVHGGNFIANKDAAIYNNNYEKGTSDGILLVYGGSFVDKTIRNASIDSDMSIGIVTLFGGIFSKNDFTEKYNDHNPDKIIIADGYQLVELEDKTFAVIQKSDVKAENI